MKTLDRCDGLKGVEGHARTNNLQCMSADSKYSLELEQRGQVQNSYFIRMRLSR